MGTQGELEWDDLPDPDGAATKDGRTVAAAINSLTMEINALRRDLALRAVPPPESP